MKILLQFKIHFISILFIFGFFTFLQGQTRIDSLKQSLQQRSGKEKVDVLNAIAEEFGSESDSAIVYARKALDLVKEMTYPYGEAKAFEHIGKSHFYKGSFAEAEKYYTFAQDLYEELDDNKGLGHVFMNLGDVYEKDGNYDMSIEYNKKAFSLFEEINDTVDMATAYHNLGYYGWISNKLDIGFEYHRKALELYEQLKNYDMAARTHNAIGVIYWRWGEYKNAQEEYLKGLTYEELVEDKGAFVLLYNNMGLVHESLYQLEVANTYYKRAYSLALQADYQYGISYSLGNIGRNFQQRSEYDSALVYYKKSLEINENLRKYDAVALLLQNIGELYYDKDELDKAKQYLQRALDMAVRYKLKYKQATALYKLGKVHYQLKEYSAAKINIKKSLDIALSERMMDLMRYNYLYYHHIYKAEGNYKDALSNYVRYAEIRDSLSSAEVNSKISELQTKYESTLKEKQIDQLTHEKTQQTLEIEQQKVFRNLYIFAVIVLVLIVTGILLMYRNKSLHNKELQSKSLEIADLNEELQARNETLLERETELQKLNATKDKFFSIIAHDLKNPFMTLLGYSDLLLHEYDAMSDKIRLERIKDMFDASTKTYEFLEGLLVWSRSQRGTLQLLFMNLNLNELIDEIFDLYNATAYKKGITLENDVPNNLSVYADLDTTKTVFRNLINNAIKFTHISGKVNVKAMKSGSNIAIYVSDTGVGISPEHLDKLFLIEESYKTEGTLQEKGSGLGLVLCKEFVEKNNGRIIVESQVGKGTTFIVELPKSLGS